MSRQKLLYKKNAEKTTLMCFSEKSQNDKATILKELSK